MVFPLFSRYRYLLWITVLVLVASGTILLAACGETGTNTGASTPTPTSGTNTGASTPTPTSGGGNTFQVKMVENNGVYSFDPTTLTVPKGTTVVWTNKSDAPHTVTSDTNAFAASSNVSENQTFQMVFATAGTYTYHCSIHPNMKATITVTG
jgi:plastocyanin